jgi:hypothetical protein
MDQLVLPDPSGRPYVVLTWDGQVLEVFGNASWFGPGCRRFHVAAAVKLEVSDPDRQGQVNVKVTTNNHDGVGFRAASGDADAIVAFLAPVQAAIGARP